MAELFQDEWVEEVVREGCRLTSMPTCSARLVRRSWWS